MTRSPVGVNQRGDPSGFTTRDPVSDRGEEGGAPSRPTALAGRRDHGTRWSTCEPGNRRAAPARHREVSQRNPRRGASRRGGRPVGSGRGEYGEHRNGSLLRGAPELDGEWTMAAVAADITPERGAGGATLSRDDSAAWTHLTSEDRPTITGVGPEAQDEVRAGTSCGDDYPIDSPQ